MVKIEREDSTQKLVAKITEYVGKEMAHNPEWRTLAYDLLNYLNGARNFGVIDE